VLHGPRGLRETREPRDEHRDEGRPARVGDDVEQDAQTLDVVARRGARRAALRLQRVQVVQLLASTQSVALRGME
jgi:hypothetical protein